MRSLTDSMIGLYQKSFREHGDSPASLLCPKGRQDIRFANLLPFLPQEGFSVLDFGCGLGHLLEYLGPLRSDFAYHGVDLVPEFIDFCRGRAVPGARFDTIAPGWRPDADYDFVFASGTFNIKVDTDPAASREVAMETIKALFRATRRVLVCDFMTTAVDFQVPGAQHFDPAAIAAFAIRDLTRRFIVMHHYLPYEFALAAFRDFAIQRPENVYATNS